MLCLIENKVASNCNLPILEHSGFFRGYQGFLLFTVALIQRGIEVKQGQLQLQQA